MKTNDAVLIQDDKITPRNNCKKEKEELIVCKDNKIEGAVLRLKYQARDFINIFRFFVQFKFIIVSQSYVSIILLVISGENLVKFHNLIPIFTWFA